MQFGTSRALKGEFLSTKKDGGTPHWMSPEALKGGQQITEKTDVWSFGMVLFEIVTRQLPWQELESEHQVRSHDHSLSSLHSSHLLNQHLYADNVCRNGEGAVAKDARRSPA